MISPYKPNWLKVKLPPEKQDAEWLTRIKQRALCTVCVEAKCPNQLECFHRGTATFLLLGPTCSRRCTFCAVGKSAVHEPDPSEPERIARTVSQMNLSYCVVTMVTRDDLRESGCQVHTLGQYIPPSNKHQPGVRYMPPDEFDWLQEEANKRRFTAIASAPLVRSSYRAAELFQKARGTRTDS